MSDRLLFRMIRILSIEGPSNVWALVWEPLTSWHLTIVGSSCFNLGHHFLGQLRNEQQGTWVKELRIQGDDQLFLDLSDISHHVRSLVTMKVSFLIILCNAPLNWTLDVSEATLQMNTWLQAGGHRDISGIAWISHIYTLLTALSLCSTSAAQLM